MDKAKNISEEPDNYSGIIRDVRTIADMEEEFARIRRKDRRNMLIVGALSALMIAVGTIMYIAKGADSADNPFDAFKSAGSQGLYSSYATSGGNNRQGYGGPAGVVGTPGIGGNCCGSSAGTVGSSSLAGRTSLPELEKQGLTKFAQESGKADVEAKATDYGCHIQIDIIDASGHVIRSYGYQGGPLYVIK